MSSTATETGAGGPALAPAVTGFICPICPGMVQLESEALLLEHWALIHDAKDVGGASVTEDQFGDTSLVLDHVFEENSVRKARVCRHCNDRIGWGKCCTCKLCRSYCHTHCAEQMMKTACPGFKQKQSSILKSIRKVVTGSKVRYVTEYVDLDLTYITKNIIAMSFPASGLEAAYRNNLNDVAAMLKAKHGAHFMVFNVSKKFYDISKMDNQVLDFGWPDHLAPPMERLCSICGSMDSWLAADARNVVVVHCKGGKGRTGCVIASYLVFKRLFLKADDAMAQFAQRRFHDAEDNKEDTGVTQPSQRRYVTYFSDLMNNRLKVWDRPLLLKTVLIQGIPNYDKGGFRPVLVIYKDLEEEVFRTPDPVSYSVKDEYVELAVGASFGLVVQGDVLIRLYHRGSSEKLIFRCQFHTAAVSNSFLSFEKKDLDEAYKDRRFPEEGSVVFIFSESYKSDAVEPGEGIGPPPASPLQLEAPEALDTAGGLLTSRRSAAASTSSDQSLQGVAVAMEAAVAQATSRPRSRTLSANPSASSLVPATIDEVEAAPETPDGDGAPFDSTDLSSISALFFDNLREGDSGPTGIRGAEVDTVRRRSGSSPVPTAAVDIPRAGANGVTVMEDGVTVSTRPRVPVGARARAKSQGARPGTSPVDEAARIELRERLQTLGSSQRRSTPQLYKVPSANHGGEEVRFIEPNCHENVPWYFGNMPAAATHRLLMEKGMPGEFLLVNDPQENVYFLYVVHNSGTEDGDYVQSYHIEWMGLEGYYIVDGTAGRTHRFPNLITLCIFFRHNRIAEIGGLAVSLSQGFGTGGLRSGHSRTVRAAALRRVSDSTKLREAKESMRSVGIAVPDSPVPQRRASLKGTAAAGRRTSSFGRAKSQA